jgi:glycosyltransferase involved in cell wall biosynthesis
MKILMIIGQYHPVTGGAEKECQKLSGRLVKEGMAVAVLTQSSPGLPDYEIIDGIPVYRKMKGWHLYEYTYMLSVLWFLVKHSRHYDIIQCFGLYLFIPPVALIKQLLKKRAVARIEGPATSGDFHRIKTLRCGRRILKSAQRFDRIISISRDISREIEDNGFSDHSVVSIPNSVDVEHFRPGSDDAVGRMGQICFVGRLAEEKGVRYLLEAMKGVREEWSGIKLVIVGDGPLRGGLEELSRQLGLMDDTVFVGQTDSVLSYYREADLFVLPSLSEGLPLSLLEALSCGLPAIATAVGGSREIVDPHDEAGTIPRSQYHIGEYGLLVNPEDVQGLVSGVLRLLNDRVLSNQLRKRARSCVQQRYAVEQVIGKYRSLYAGLVGKE